MKKTFVFYSDRIDYTDEMTLEEKGLFFETILNYKNGKEIGNIEKIKFLWTRVKKQLDDDFEKRQKEVEHRKKAGKLGGIASAIKRKQVLANGSKSKQIQPENVNVNVKENIIYNHFENFRNQYPKKKGKGKAKLVYEKIIKSNQATHEQIIQGVLAYSKEITFKKIDEGYIKRPQGRLNEARRDDDYGFVQPNITDETRRFDFLDAEVKKDKRPDKTWIKSNSNLDQEEIDIIYQKRKKHCYNKAIGLK